MQTGRRIQTGTRENVSTNRIEKKGNNMATTQEIMDKLLNISACDACSDVQENEELDLYDSPPTSDDYYRFDEEEEEDDYEGEEDTYAGDDYEYYFGDGIDYRYSLADAVDRIQSHLSDIADDLSDYKYRYDVLNSIGSDLERIWKQVIELEFSTDSDWEYEQ